MLSGLWAPRRNDHGFGQRGSGNIVPCGEPRRGLRWGRCCWGWGVFQDAARGGTYPFEVVDTAPRCEADDDEAQVYVVRGSHFATAITIPVWANCEYVGVVRAKTYFCLTLPPGPTEFVARSETTARMSVTLETGKPNYIYVGLKPGAMSTRVRLDRLPDDEIEAHDP